VDEPDFWQQQEQELEQQWLQDEAAQVEFQSWLDQLNEINARQQ